MKLEMDHTSRKLSKIFKDVDLDMDAVDELWQLMISDPAKVFGEEKSRVIEYMAEAVETEDPVKLAVLSTVLAKGIEAMMAMQAMQEQAMEALKNIPPDELPPEIRAKLEGKGVLSKDETSTDEVEDEFERLKRKYS